MGKGILDRIYVEAAPISWEVADDSPSTQIAFCPFQKKSEIDDKNWNEKWKFVWDDSPLTQIACCNF